VNSPVAAELPAVFVDHEQAGRMAIEHLYARGLRRFVTFCDFGRVGETELAQGAAQAAAELACAHTSHQSKMMIGKSPASWEHFYLALKKEAQNWRAPMGIVAGRDLRGRQLVDELQILGWSVPQDLAIVSTHNDHMYCDGYPSLSSVDMGYQVNGYEAARLLLASLLRVEKAPTSPIITPPKELVLRQSSDFFAVTNEQVAREISQLRK
jgi:LacI family transcriptional regulator